MGRRTLDIEGPFSLPRTLGGDATGTWRATRTPAGAVTMRLRQVGGRLEAEAWGPGREWALDQLPALVGADDDPTAFQPTHPRLRELSRRFAGMRLGHSRNVMEALIPAILGQKVTIREAGRSARSLTAVYGEDAPGPGSLRLPPAPEVLGSLPYEAYHPLGIERRRAETIRTCARRHRRLEEIIALPADRARARLLALPGVGPWTAAFVMAGAWGDRDAVPVGDFHLPHTVSWALAGEPRGNDDRMLELLEPYRGQRWRVVRLLKAGGIHAPRYGPRIAVRSIAHI